MPYDKNENMLGCYVRTIDLIEIFIFIYIIQQLKSGKMGVGNSVACYIRRVHTKNLWC